MDGLSRAASAVAIARKVKRAKGLLRDAERDLALLAAGQDVVGVQRVQDATDADAVTRLVELGLGLHGAVEVVVLARPMRRAQNTPTTAP